MQVSGEGSHVLSSLERMTHGRNFRSLKYSVRLELMKGARGSSLSFHQLFTNSLTKFHKRGQNPHGESHKGASSPNSGMFNQPANFCCSMPSIHPRRYTHQVIIQAFDFPPLSSPSHILSFLPPRLRLLVCVSFNFSL